MLLHCLSNYRLCWLILCYAEGFQGGFCAYYRGNRSLDVYLADFESEYSIHFCQCSLQQRLPSSRLEVQIHKEGVGKCDVGGDINIALLETDKWLSNEVRIEEHSEAGYPYILALMFHPHQKVILHNLIYIKAKSRLLLHFLLLPKYLLFVASNLQIGQKPTLTHSYLVLQSVLSIVGCRLQLIFNSLSGLRLSGNPLNRFI